MGHGSPRQPLTRSRRTRFITARTGPFSLRRVFPTGDSPRSRDKQHGPADVHIYLARCVPSFQRCSPSRTAKSPADGLVPISSAAVARTVDDPVPRFLGTDSAFDLPNDSGDTSSPDAFHALLDEAPLAPGAGDPHDATSVDSRTARRLRRVRLADAQFARLCSSSHPHGRAAFVSVREDILPLSCRDSAAPSQRAAGAIPSDMASVPFDGDANAVPLTGHRLTFSRNNDIVTRYSSGVHP